MRSFNHISTSFLKSGVFCKWAHQFPNSYKDVNISGARHRYRRLLRRQYLRMRKIGKLILLLVANVSPEIDWAIQIAYKRQTFRLHTNV